MKLFALSLAVSLAFLAVTLSAMRRRALRDQMAVLWLAVSAVMVILTLTLPGHQLDHLAHLVGVAYGSDLVLVSAVIFLLLLTFQLSLTVARLNARTTRMAQELALLRGDQAVGEHRTPHPGSAAGSAGPDATATERPPDAEDGRCP